MFSIGILSFIGAGFMILVYLISRIFKMFGSYLERRDGPKDRVLWYIVIFGIFGFVLGCLAQPQWDDLYACYQNSGSWQQCLLPSHK